MSSNWDAVMELTVERLKDPQPGDRFHEMFSFWVIVEEVSDTKIVVTELFGKNRDKVHMTRDHFVEKYTYSTMRHKAWVVWDEVLKTAPTNI